MKYFIWLVAASLLCFEMGARAEKKVKVEEKSSSASASPALEPKQEKLIVTKQGIGPINSGTKFDQGQIQKLLPGYVVNQSKNASEGEEFSILQVLRNGRLLLTINPGLGGFSIFSVVVEDNEVKNSLGPQIGSMYKEVFKGGQTPSCSAGMEEQSGTVSCASTESPNILYQFTGQSDVPDGSIPSSKVLADWKIKSIFWKP